MKVARSLLSSGDMDASAEVLLQQAGHASSMLQSALQETIQGLQSAQTGPTVGAASIVRQLSAASVAAAALQQRAAAHTAVSQAPQSPKTQPQSPKIQQQEEAEQGGRLVEQGSPLAAGSPRAAESPLPGEMYRAKIRRAASGAGDHSRDEERADDDDETSEEHNGDGADGGLVRKSTNDPVEAIESSTPRGKSNSAGIEQESERRRERRRRVLSVGSDGVERYESESDAGDGHATPAGSARTHPCLFPSVSFPD